MTAMKFLFDPDAAGKQNELIATDIRCGESTNRSATALDTVQWAIWTSATILPG
jgi:hypothetical protein